MTDPSREGDLFYFYNPSCPWTKKATPEVDSLNSALEKEGSNKVVELNVRVKENYQLYEAVNGHTTCGGVPFFYNRATNRSICGFVQAEVLKNWAGLQQNQKEN